MNYNREDFLNVCRQVLVEGKELRFKVSGASMLPTLQDQDVVIIKSINPDELKPGDIIFYYTTNFKVVVHRVFKIKTLKVNKLFWVKGDYNPYFDLEFYPENLLGKIIKAERMGKPLNIIWSPLRLELQFYLTAIKIKVSMLYKTVRHKYLGRVLQAIQSTTAYRKLASRLYCIDNFNFKAYSSAELKSLTDFYRRNRLFLSEPALEEAVRRDILPQASDDYLLLAWYKKKTVGSIKVSYKNQEAEVTHWVVAWLYRRLGIGRSLMQKALTQIKQKPGISRIILKTGGVTGKTFIINLLKLLQKEFNFEIIVNSEGLDLNLYA
jgi:signal peptidase I